MRVWEPWMVSGSAVCVGEGSGTLAVVVDCVTLVPGGPLPRPMRGMTHYLGEYRRMVMRMYVVMDNVGNVNNMGKAWPVNPEEVRECDNVAMR